VAAEAASESGLARDPVIVRDLTPADSAALDSFDLGGQPSAWLDEGAEIVAGLARWRDDAEHAALDRCVAVAELDSGIVAVAAHERIEHETLGPLAEHRYVMVVAVRADHRRGGIATALLESILAEMQLDGVRSASWLAHPANLGSVAFSRTSFPDADETYPPDDRPYARFSLRL